MADDGAAPAGGAPAPGGPGAGGAGGPGDQQNHHGENRRPSGINTHQQPVMEQIDSPLSPGMRTPNPFSRQQTSLDLDDYFSGPRDISKHSKWPIPLQMHGSIVPKLIVPLILMAAWSTWITVLTQLKIANLAINSVLLTVLGFVVGLGLSFRSSTAYERYAEGRRYWATLILACQCLGRVIWVHGKEREGEQKTKDVLAKLSALNLLTAFAVALKHKLRFEPYTSYEDLQNLVGHLDTLAGEATRANPDGAVRQRTNPFKASGEMLGLAFATSNPRKTLKKATRPLGNLPLEILSYLAAYIDDIVANQQLTVPMQQTLAYNNLGLLNDVLTGTERVLSTPLPIAYSIAVGQITYLYLLLLPFQLVGTLDWKTIPATVAASYIILGLLYIGTEIENPFGQDVNDLPLESYCAQIAAELDVLTNMPRPQQSSWVESLDNRVLYPYSQSGWHVWEHRGEAKVREAIKAKTELGFESRKRMMGQEDGPNEGGHHSSHSNGLKKALTKASIEKKRQVDVESQPQQ